MPLCFDMTSFYILRWFLDKAVVLLFLSKIFKLAWNFDIHMRQSWVYKFICNVYDVNTWTWQYAIIIVTPKMVGCISLLKKSKFFLEFKIILSVVNISEKAMAPHSSTLAWKIPWMEEPGRQSMGSLRVGHHWATSLSLFTFLHWRRKWQPTPVFLAGESQGRRSLVGCPLWGCTESDTTEATQQQQQQWIFCYHFVSFLKERV